MDLMVLRAARSRDLIVASASFLLVAETDARRIMMMVAKAVMFFILIKFMVAATMAMAMTKWL